MADKKLKVLAERDGKIIYLDGNTKIKVFNDTFSKADVLNEALNQARVEQTGLPIPKIIEVMKYDGKWAIRSEYIEGKTLTQIMQEDKKNTDKYLEQFVDLLDVLIGELLNFSIGTAFVVFGNFFFLNERGNLVVGVTAQIADGNLSFFAFGTNDLR